MPKPFVVLALIAAGYMLYDQYGDRLPTAGGDRKIQTSGSISAIANSPDIVTGGATSAAEGIAE